MVVLLNVSRWPNRPGWVLSFVLERIDSYLCFHGRLNRENLVNDFYFKKDN